MSGVTKEDAATTTTTEGKGDEVKEEEDDLVANYPDSAAADSGNRRLSSEEDMKDLIIMQQATRDPSDAIDPWEDLPTIQAKAWAELTTPEKILYIGTGFVKIVGVFVLYYFFVCALDILNVSLRLIGGKNTGRFVKDNPVITNPVGGIVVGLLVTVLVQSSSTSTSIINNENHFYEITVMQVSTAIPLVMGANIGTSITNTAVAMAQLKDRNQFKRAFAGATVHDTFNMLTTIILITLEVSFGYLENLTQLMVDSLKSGSKVQNVDFLKILTQSFVERIVKIDNEIESCWRNGDDPKCADLTKLKSMLCGRNPPTCDKQHLLRGTSLSDQAAGLILFFACVLVICICLVIVVKILSSLLKGRIARVIRTVVNYEFPSCPWVTGYIAILAGTILTFLVQSSSVFTAALTPLVGIGVVSLEIMYPLTLGANIGTTTTAVIASFAAANPEKPKPFKASLQIALCHLFFNVTGILIFYPVPFMRWPVFLAKRLGKTSSQYRWFAVVYIILAFFIVPAFLFAVSFLGVLVALIVLYFLSLVFAIIVAVNYLQDNYPNRLPPGLRNWDWLPKPMHSLEPYHNFFIRCECCQKLQAKNAPLSNLESTVTLTRTSMKVKAGPKPSNISLISFPTGGTTTNKDGPTNINPS